MSTIFIEDATILDCAIFHPQRGPCGHTWKVDILWEGEKNQEGMLFDFGLAKKSAKGTIDQEFDHKILVTANQIKHQDHLRTIVADSFAMNDQKFYFCLSTYNQAIRKIPKKTMMSIQDNNISLLEADIASDILRNSPENIKSIQITLKEHEQSHLPHYYRYTHSLCFHYGNCQRFHGHSNVVQVFENGFFNVEKSTFIAKKLNHKFLISKKHIVPESWDSKAIQEMLEYCPDIAEDKENYEAIQYSGSQGTVALILPKISVLSLDQESTVENLAEFIRRFFPAQDSISVRAFEGLAKGSVAS